MDPSHLPIARAGSTAALRAVAVAALLAAAACRGAHAPAAELEADPARLLAGLVATCASASGDVQVRRAAESTWEPAAPGAVVHAGDELRTGARARARIALLGGGLLDLDDSTAVVVDRQPLDGAPGAGTLRSAPRDGGGETRVAVKAGVVRGTLPRPGGAGGAVGVVVRSSDGSAVRIASRPGLETTTFRLVHQEIGTELAVLDGAATVNGANGETALAAGHFAVARRGELGEPAELIPPPERLDPPMDGRVHFAAGVAVRLRWSEVRGATAYRIQVSRDPSFRQVEAGDVVERNEWTFRPPGEGAYVWRVAARDVAGGWGEFGVARRLHCDEGPPRDVLVKPPDGAVVRSPGDLARVALAWEAPGEGGAVRVVVARSPDLLVDPAAAVVVRGDHAAVEVPSPGEYWWGVYAEDGGVDPRPLFTRARHLSVRRAAGARPEPARVEVPKAISQWGN